MIKEIKDILTELVFEAVKARSLEIELSDIVLEHPAEMSFGDYATNIALRLGQKNNRQPKELASEIIAEIKKINNENIAKVELAGPGFINFYLTPVFLTKEIGKILEKGSDYGRGEKKNKKVLVEYSSPNIAKPFSIGHLRSTIIGDAVANILSFSGFEIIRDNHLGDWGTQFGKQIVAIKKWGNEKEISQSENPVKELVALYVKFHEEAEKDPSLDDEARAEFLKLEQGDEEAKEIWQKCIDWSLIEFNKIYSRLGIQFDNYLGFLGYSGESAFVSRVGDVYEALKDKNLLRESEGADLVFFENDKLPPMIVRKKDGSSIYATRDLATDLVRREMLGDEIKIINEVGSEQELYMKQLYETEKMLGWFKEGQRVHVSHGLYRFLTGKMSTRKGNIIWLEDVINEVVTRASRKTFMGDFGNKENVDEAIFNDQTVNYQGTVGEITEKEKIAEIVGIGALKYNDLKRDSKSNIIFDWEEVLNLRGNSGPYLQYTYARIQSILAKAKKMNIKPDITVGDEVTKLEKLLYRFSEVVERAGLEYAPHYVANYLYSLASAFSSYYVDHQVVSLEVNSPYRVALAEAVGVVLKNGLDLLGIKAPEKM